jgi:hypothetical protein
MEIIFTLASVTHNWQLSETTSLSVRIEVPTAVEMIMFFWVLTPCGLVGRYKHFGRNILSPSSGLKWQSWEVELFIWGQMTQP